MLPVSESDVFGRGVDILVLCALTFDFTHARKPEAVECTCVRVVCLVVVCGTSRGENNSALGNECAVVERNVLQCFPCDGR